MTHRQRIYNALRKQVAPVTSLLDKGDLYGAMAMIPLLSHKPVMDALQRVERSVFVDEAERAYRNIESEAARLEKRFTFTSVDWLNEIFQYLTQRSLFYLSTEITETTRNRLLSLFNDAISQGWSQLDIAKQIEQTREFTRLTFKSLRARSLTIARTETGRARNAGHQAAANSSPWVTEKVWIATNDARTRGRQPNSHASHSGLNRVAVDADALFRDPINGDEMAYPGDIEHGATAQSVINCRCRIVSRPKVDANGRPMRKVQP